MRSFFAAAFAATALLAAPVALADGTLTLEINKAELLRLNAAAAGVVVANPEIAAVTVQSAATLVVTGKKPGITNVIVVDGADRVIYAADVRVVGPEDRPGQTVNVTHGKNTTRYECAPACEASSGN
jgi:Flp pilus assembly secretin CpaC